MYLYITNRLIFFKYFSFSELSLVKKRLNTQNVTLVDGHICVWQVLKLWPAEVHMLEILNLGEKISRKSFARQRSQGFGYCCPFSTKPFASTQLSISMFDTDLCE